MGNQHSSEDKPSTPATPSRKERDVSQSRQSKSSAAKIIHPTTSTPSTSTTYAQATVTASPASSHSRNRSITASNIKTSSPSSMGNTVGTPRSSTLPLPEREKPQPSPSSQPVDVPQHPSAHDGLNEKEHLTPPTGSSPFGLPPSNFSRPPRLPLPIERDPEPTSPIIGPEDAKRPAEQSEVDLPQRTSLLSTTTLDDDDAADIEQFAAESDPLAQKVPTSLLWNGTAAKAVYVTGTFANWERKFRMHRNQDGVFAATIPLPAGTHHITFLVDGEPMTSTDMPTTVDFANALVNYIEVVTPESPTADKQPPAPAEPMPIPGATDAPSETSESLPSTARPQGVLTERRAPEVSSTLHETVAPAPGVPEQPQPVKEVQQSEAHPQQQQPTQNQKKHATIPKKQKPRPKYTSEIPEVLLHLDLYGSPEDERFRRASKAVQHLPQPPTLPMFMSKSILNATTPHKDDASVLTMPNHTVLNHLATSSIKNGVLATSGTTRYKRKVRHSPTQISNNH